MKLFPKLALSISSLLVGTLLCLSLFFYWSEERQLRFEAGQDRLAILHNLVHIAQESFLSNDDLLLVKYTRWLEKWNPSLVSASVVDPHGAILAHSEPTRIGKQDSLPPKGLSQVLVLSEPVRLGAQWVATASVAFSEQTLQMTLNHQLTLLKRRMEGIVFISLILGVCLALGLASSLSRPINELSRLAESIGQGHWDIEVGPLNRRPDELGSLTKAFSKMAEQLRQLDTMKEDFVSAVTHELRSPLGAIESYLNLIGQELHEGIPIPAWENYLERLRINTQRLTRFVNDLLDVAALERGKLKLECRSIQLISLAEDVVGLLALKLREKELSYEVVSPSNIPEVFADPEKIRQVVINLISNAIKFTPNKGRIEIRLDTQETWGVRLSVRDSGLGIAEEDQVKIFSKFEQVHSARQTIKGPKGTGLGLAISRALIELHGQSLNVQSQKGQGSTFYFTLPYAKSIQAIPA
jgi:signal transduction histidine kinase